MDTDEDAQTNFSHCLLSEDRCYQIIESESEDPYLVHSNVVAWLLKARPVVIPVPHNNPHLVQNDGANQLIGALNLNHDGGDVVWWLRKTEDDGNACLFDRHAD